jgi:hypothetical protein
MKYKPVKRIQKPLLALPDAISGSITRILNFAEFKKVSEKLRMGRAEEQKKRMEARVLKIGG